MRKVWLVFDQYDDTFCAPMIYIQRFEYDPVRDRRVLVSAHPYKATKNNTWRILNAKFGEYDEIVFH